MSKLDDLTHPKKIEEKIQVGFLQSAMRNIDFTKKVGNLGDSPAGKFGGSANAG